MYPASLGEDLLVCFRYRMSLGADAIFLNHKENQVVTALLIISLIFISRTCLDIPQKPESQGISRTYRLDDRLDCLDGRDKCQDRLDSRNRYSDRLDSADSRDICLDSLDGVPPHTTSFDTTGAFFFRLPDT